MIDSMRLLLVDDQEAAAGRVLERLARSGRSVHSVRVDSFEALNQALCQAWDAVLCNDTMPGFDAAAVLGMVQELAPDLPLIVLTGAVGEEAAVDYMRLGARDVVLRGNLGRLLPALDREIAEAKLRAHLRRSEDLLLRSHRLRTVGEMAAGVAHDVRNVLNPIHLNVQLAERACDARTPETIVRALADIRRLTMRAVQTVERLRDYGRPVVAAPPGALELNALVTEACDVARPRIASRGVPCRIVEDLGTPPPTRGFAGEVLSALVNLILNAIDAMPDGGTVTLSTGEQDGAAFICVGDDGPGMPPEVAAHVFEPFFTTKGDRGTGLGLATVHGCMKQHGGGIALETVPGRGARFTLSFPRYPALTPPGPGLATTRPPSDVKEGRTEVG